MEKREKLILFFDGYCGFCHRFIRFVLFAMKQEPFFFAPLKSPLFKALLPVSVSPPDSVAVYSKRKRRLYFKAEAVRLVFSQLKYPWKVLFYFLDFAPMSILNSTYDIIAKSRWSFFKMSDQNCPIVPSSKKRFFITALPDEFSKE